MTEIDEGQIIVIREDTVIEYPIPPKSFIPIEAVYYPSSVTIIVNFLANLGMVSIEIENQTTSEYCQNIEMILSGPMLFPISGTPGHWRITFTLSSGKVYYGVFDN